MQSVITASEGFGRKRWTQRPQEHTGIDRRIIDAAVGVTGTWKQVGSHEGESLVANGQRGSAQGSGKELRKKNLVTAAMTGLMRGTWVLKHRRSGSGWRRALQAGPNVALWGDAEVQEGVRMCRKARVWISVRSPGAFRFLCGSKGPLSDC